ncbi:hypothetical protein [Lacticaseibacillus paracasei]|uniref:hypothetical protein n=1 Tax=Lacticaseibacillus paracasei TaxID=1597 RepID=UPI003CED308D
MEFGRWRENDEYNLLWPDDELDFWKLLPNGQVHTHNWSGIHWKDYLEAADEYYDAGVRIANEIILSGHDNRKTDCWFLADTFMFRHAIELLLKAKMYSSNANKPNIQQIFKTTQHNVEALFAEVEAAYEYDHSITETDWIRNYLRELETIDSNSTFFRYPLTKEFFLNDPPEYVDIQSTTEKMKIAYCLLRRGYDDDERFNSHFPEAPPSTEFFSQANDGIGNCFFDPKDQSEGDDQGRPKSYYIIIKGYSCVSEFLFSTKSVTSQKSDALPRYRYLPELFSLRHLLELELKNLANSRYSKIQQLNIRSDSHEVFSKLWRNLLPILKGPKNSVTDNIDPFIDQIQQIDRNEEFFRYPAGYNHQYNSLNCQIDLVNVFYCIKKIANFLESCDSMFEYWTEVESENEFNSDLYI